MVTVVLTSSLSCATTATATSNTIVINVSAVTASVIISTPVTNICPGANVTFTAAATNGGTTPVYQWKRNSINVGTNSSTYSSNTLVNGDVISATLLSNAACASTATVASNNITMLVNNSTNASILISGNTTVAIGSSTVISSAIINAGNSFAYQWQDSTKTHTWQNISGSNVPTLYFYTPLDTGNKLRCLLTGVSSTCAGGGNFIISNTLTFTINPPGGRIHGYVRYYPNPVTTNITIDSLNLKDNWETLTISNTAGAKTGIVQNIAGLTKATINVVGLPAGIYFAILNNRFDGMIFFKFVKL